MCIFGCHPEKRDRSKLRTVTKGIRPGTHEEAAIAEMPFRQYCAVACVNGELKLKMYFLYE